MLSTNEERDYHDFLAWLLSLRDHRRVHVERKQKGTTMVLLIESDTATAIRDSLADGTAVRVYNGREKLIAIGVVVDCYKSGIRVKLSNGWANWRSGHDELTFFYAGGLTVVEA